MTNLSINSTLSQRENDSQSQMENDSQPQRDDDSQSHREDGYQSQRDDDSHNFLKGQRASMVLQLDELGTAVSELKTTNREQETTIAQQGITVKDLNLKYENLDLKHNDLNVKFNASETTRRNASALVMAFDLIKLFRSYDLSMYNWNAVTEEYKSINDGWENDLMSKADFDQYISDFNVTYPTPPNIPRLSDIIGLCQNRHAIAHSGQIKTIVKQRDFIDECQLYFTSNDISESISRVCLPIILKMSNLKRSGALRGL